MAEVRGTKDLDNAPGAPPEIRQYFSMVDLGEVALWQKAAGGTLVHVEAVPIKTPEQALSMAGLARAISARQPGRIETLEPSPAEALEAESAKADRWYAERRDRIPIILTAPGNAAASNFYANLRALMSSR